MKHFLIVTRCRACNELSSFKTTGGDNDGVPYVCGTAQWMRVSCIHCSTDKCPMIIQVSYTGWTDEGENQK